MAQLVFRDEDGSFSIEQEETGRSILSPFRLPGSFSQRSSSIASVRNSDEYELHWAAIEKLPISRRIRTSLFDVTKNGDGEEVGGKRVVDVTKLSPLERRLFIERLIKHIENDNLRLV